MEEYQRLQEWAEYEPPRQVPKYQGPLYRGGETYKEKSVPKQKPSRQRAQDQASFVKIGIIGSMYPHTIEGMAPGGGGGTPPLGKGGAPDTKSDDESKEGEGDERDTDEETVSETSSSQVSAGKGKSRKWDTKRGGNSGGAGGPPEDPGNPTRGGGMGDGCRGPQGHRGQRGGTGPPGRDRAPGRMGLVGPRGFPRRDGLSTTGGPFTSMGLGMPPVFNANLSTIGMENSLH